MTMAQMLRVLGFFLVWGLGLWPPLFGPGLVMATGVALFFLAVPLITRRLGLGGYPELGLARHAGWQRNLVAGLALGSLYPLLLFAGLALTGQVDPLGWAPWPGLLTRGLFLLVHACYIGFWEELLCRGYLLRVLPDRWSRLTTLVAVGVVFSLFHLPRLGAPAAWWGFWFVSGILFALPVLATGSLWFSVGAHWGLDLFWFALLLDDGLLRYGPEGTGALNGGGIALLSVLPLLALVAWLAPRLARR